MALIKHRSLGHILELLGHCLPEEVVIKFEHNEGLVRGSSIHALMRCQVIAVDTVLCSVM